MFDTVFCTVHPLKNMLGLRMGKRVDENALPVNLKACISRREYHRSGERRSTNPMRISFANDTRGGLWGTTLRVAWGKSTMRSGLVVRLATELTVVQDGERCMVLLSQQSNI